MALYNMNSDKNSDSTLAYKIEKSPIHGRGLFAERDIAKGEFIVEYKGEIIDDNEADKRGEKCAENGRKKGSGMVYIFRLENNLCLDGNFEYNDARFMNHACRTNCEAVMENRRILFYAQRNISKGEELLYNYAYPFEDCLEHPCHCGFPECVGYIVAKEDWPKLRRFLRNRRLGKEKRATKNNSLKINK